MSKSWQKVPLKYLVRKIGSGKTPKGGAEVYVKAGVMLLRSQNIHFDGLRLDDVVFIDEAVDEEMASTRVLPRDVLLNITGASIGRCTVVPDHFDDANVNQHVCIIRTNPERLHPEYLGAVLQSNVIQTSIRVSENGSSREGLTFEQIGAFEIPLPPLEEQRIVVSEVGAKLQVFLSAITEKQHLLSLLTEKRRAVIADFVTKGLNKDAPRRDSGIPWIGEIPEHWQAFPLRRLICSLEQGWSPVASNLPADPDEIGVLKLSAIKNGRFVPDENKALAPDAEIPAGLSVCEGDVFITRANTPKLVGDVALSERDYANLIFSDLIYRLKIDARRALPAWMVLALLSDIGRTQIESEAKGSSGSMVKLAQDQVLGIVLPVPPLMEQQAIVEYVQNEINKLDALADATERTIALLQERRSALISAAVTGNHAVTTLLPIEACHAD